jgi:FixJ family two-component response regulator
MKDLGREAGIAEIQERVKRLTAREAEVLALVVTGMLNKQIAAALVRLADRVGPKVD